MKLNERELADAGQWANAGIELPRFDRRNMIESTLARPAWLHMGAGNIFRAFPAALQQKLLDDGLDDTGILVAEGFDYELVDAILKPRDNLSLLVTLKADGSIDKSVIASLAQSYRLDSGCPDFSLLKDIFRAPSLQMVSFTITEKGYALRRGDDFLPDVADDMRDGPAAPKSYMGKVAALLLERHLAGGHPLAMVSMDNCSHNGDKLFEAVHAFAERWEKAGLAPAGFAAYVGNPERVSFPWTMIDKITPRPDPDVVAMLAACRFDDADVVVTARGTHAAPFVNAEETEYLVVEDAFPNGKPPLDKVGVIFTDRATVDKVEKMKVGACLNPVHTALAIFGCLLGQTKISEEMRNPDLRALAEQVGYDEGLPVAVDPGIIEPRRFLDQVIRVRLPNPFMPDTPQRIATDTSQKLAVRFGETIKAYLARNADEAGTLRIIPLVFAGWCRYLVGVDDAGREFALSPDPLLDDLKARFSGMKLGEAGAIHETLAPLLSDSRIFGVDLYKAGLGQRVEDDFAAMLAGPGAVRSVLRNRLGRK